MHKVLLVVLIQVIYLSVFSQNVIIKGKILNEINSNEINFANVYIDSLYIVTSSTNGGVYELHNLPLGKCNLCVSHIGFQKACMPVQLTHGVNIVNILLTPKNDTLTPIVITGTGTRHRIEDVPVQTKIITKKDIAELSCKSIEEVISSITSSVDYTTSSMGTNIKINGLGSNYVLILLNGKRLTSGVGALTDLSHIDTEGVEQIEIVKGASSTLYGSDAIAGVINIITKKDKHNFSTSNSTRIGAYGVLKQLNTVSFRSENISSKTSFNYKQKDAYQLNSFKYNNKWERNHNLPYLLPTNYCPVNKTRAYTINQFFEYSVSSKLSLNTEVSWYEKRLFLPFKAQMHDYYYNNRTASVGGKYKLQNKNFITFNIDVNNYLYYTEYPYKYNESYIASLNVVNKTYYPGDRNKNSDQLNINGQVKSVFNLNTKNKLSIGADLMGEFLEAQYRLTQAKVQAFTYALYAQNEIKLHKNIDLVAGIRAIYHDKSGFMLTPKLTAMYKEQRFTYRLTYSNGYKSPTLKELYYYYESDRMGMYRLYLGNADLKPQQSHYVSFSTEFKINRFRTGINVYVNRINNKIDYRIDTTSYEHRRLGIEETKKRYNIDKAQTTGSDWHFSLNILKQFSISGGYSYVNAINITQKVRLNGVSAHSATVKAAWTKKWKYYKLNLHLSGVYRSDRFYLEDDLKRTYALPYQLWKLTTSHSILKITNINLTFIAGIENIFNYIDKRPYGAHYGTLNAGRTLFAGINIKYAKQNNLNNFRNIYK